MDVVRGTWVTLRLCVTTFYMVSVLDGGGGWFRHGGS